MTPPPEALRDPLRERLIQEALDLLARDGIESLTLRRIARRAGVSHSAPLRHFPSLAALLAHVAARGFALLSETIEKSGAQLPPGSSPLARLQAAARAYVEVAVANPGLFALMFRPDRLDFALPELQEQSMAAFEHVVRGVRAAQDAGWHPARDTRVLAGAVWSAVHGLATLWSQAAFQGPVPDASLDDAIHTTLELVIGEPVD